MKLAELSRRLFEARLAALPAVLRDDVRAALAAAPARRTEVQRYLASKFESELRPQGPARERELAKAFPADQAPLRALALAIEAEQKKRIAFPEVRALYDLPGEGKTRLLRRGDYLSPGAEVKPGVLTVLATPEPFRWAPPGKEARTSGRRLAFARWLTQPGHPLTARVMVNRIWMHHFGEALVSTPENFGRSGALPTHPELLDWLATEFVRSGWSIKHVHRLILLSTAYRQTSTIDADRHARFAHARKVDPDNRLLWRQRLRRLEAESLRDAILAVSGTLDASKFGPPVPMVRHSTGEVVTPSGPEGNRRSVYLQVRRSQPLTILRAFDQPAIETNCTRRPSSTVVSQALVLLNSDFLTAQGEAFAARLLAGGADDLTGEAVQLAFGRPATPRERRLLSDFLTKQTARYGGPDARRRALADLCQMLLRALARRQRNTPAATALSILVSSRSSCIAGDDRYGCSRPRHGAIHRRKTRRSAATSLWTRPASFLVDRANIALACRSMLPGHPPGQPARDRGERLASITSACKKLTPIGSISRL